MQCAAIARSTGRQCRRTAMEASDWCAAHHQEQDDQDDGSLSGVAATGDRLATLKHLRQTLAEVIDEGPPPRDLAALSRRLQVVLEEIAELEDSGAGESKADELARRRREREAVSS